MNWTGHILTGPRADLPQLLARPESERTGVYLLHGSDPGNPDDLCLYIGESDRVASRLRGHGTDDSKAFWERTCIITSKDQNLTKAHVRYLEARLIGIAQAAGRATLANGTAPPLIALPEADRSDMEFFIDQIRLILPVLGLNVFREAPRPSEPPEAEPAASAPQGPVFELTIRRSGQQARAREIDGDFVVLAGSQAVREWKQDSTRQQGYAKLHQRMLGSGKLFVEAGSAFATLTEDIAFASPSAASAVLLGRSDNGRRTWKLAGTQTDYATWQNEQIAALNPDPAG